MARPASPGPKILWADTNNSNNEISEGASAGTSVGITAQASKGGSKFSYSLTQGSDAFAIDPRTGAITAKDGSLLDYETAHSKTVTVKATSAGVTSSQDFTINLKDVYTITDVTLGGNYTATSENDYYVVDLTTFKSQVGVEPSYRFIAGFDPNHDKVVLANFSYDSTNIGNGGRDFDLHGQSSDGYFAFSRFTTNDAQTSVAVRLTDPDTADIAYIEVVLSGVTGDSGLSKFNQFGFVTSGTFEYSDLFI
ncbi:cadherin repeat domain-containing protein [Microvirga sesbaniae]|uniref:cadherin repeat domain-containing protein n=1 Tax=Microvirga sesbaniae TaxID=681392 RepID=UPI0021C95D75|nr:cadherin repeat domain-containing protein [Microvirga sp. HBU67692]